MSARQLGELDQALEFYDQVLELDPDARTRLDEAIELRSEKGDHDGVERSSRCKLEHANDADDQAKMLETFDQLGELYQKKLGWIGEAIDAYEAAQTLDPDNTRAQRAARRALR